MKRLDGDRCFYWMGFCLFCVQAAERSIASAIQVALPPDATISLEALEADEEEDHRRKTLGRLVEKLKHQARINPGVENRLSSFVERRNVFVHHFLNRFDLNASSGCDEAIEFCQLLASDALQLANLFHAVTLGFVGEPAPVTGGTVEVDWDAMPEEIAEPLKEIARFLPAIIRERKVLNDNRYRW